VRGEDIQQINEGAGQRGQGIVCLISAATSNLKQIPYIKAGIVFRSPISLSWDQLLGGQINVEETLPWSVQGGLSWRISRTVIASFELEYQGTQSIRFVNNGTPEHPDYLETGLFKNFHPHIGVQFLHEKSGAELRVGFFTFANNSREGLDAQPAFSFGIGGYTANNFKIDFALIDTLIFDIFVRTNQFERFLLSIEYSF